MKAKLENAKEHLLTGYGILHGMDMIIPSQINAQDRLEEAIWWLEKSLKLLFPSEKN